MIDKQLKSYVIRSRMTERQQQALNTYWPLFGIELAEQAIDFDSLFGRVAPVVLEIGFGMGGSLLALASSHPGINFLGIEVHKPGVGALLAGMAVNGINNIRIIAADALAALYHMIPNESLAGTLLFFPDPWPKRRHHKRRIVQPSFVQLIQQKLIPGGYFHLATDIKSYALHMSHVIDKCDSFTIMTEPRKNLDRPKTKFELRGERLGHEISDLIYQKAI